VIKAANRASSLESVFAAVEQPLDILMMAYDNYQADEQCGHYQA